MPPLKPRLSSVSPCGLLGHGDLLLQVTQKGFLTPQFGSGASTSAYRLLGFPHPDFDNECLNTCTHQCPAWGPKFNNDEINERMKK